MPTGTCGSGLMQARPSRWAPRPRAPGDAVLCTGTGLEACLLQVWLGSARDEKEGYQFGKGAEKPGSGCWTDHIAGLRNFSEGAERGGDGLALGFSMSLLSSEQCHAGGCQADGCEWPPWGPAAQELELGASSNCSHPRSPSRSYGR